MRVLPQQAIIPASKYFFENAVDHASDVLKARGVGTPAPTPLWKILYFQFNPAPEESAPGSVELPIGALRNANAFRLNGRYYPLLISFARAGPHLRLSQ